MKPQTTRARRSACFNCAATRLSWSLTYRRGPVSGAAVASRSTPGTAGATAASSATRTAAAGSGTTRRRSARPASRAGSSCAAASACRRASQWLEARDRLGHARVGRRGRLEAITEIDEASGESRAWPSTTRSAASATARAATRSAGAAARTATRSTRATSSTTA